MVTRNVGFERTLFFYEMDGYATESVIEEVIELLEYQVMPQDDDISIEDLLTTHQRRYPCTGTRDLSFESCWLTGEG